MNRSLWQHMLGIEPSPGAEMVGEARLELSALPGGGSLLFLALVLPGIMVAIWFLARRERSDLSRSRRAVIVGLRTVALLAVVAMLTEPVLITSRRETIPSHLLMIVDHSESMRFSDPYSDEARASSVATLLGITSEGGKAPADRLRETPRIDLVRRALAPHLDRLGEGRSVSLDTLESAGQAAASSPDRPDSLDAIEADRAISPLGDALRGVLTRYRGRPVAGVVLISDGRSNAGEDPVRVAEAAANQGIPIFAVAAGSEEGPRNVRLADLEVSPVAFVRDPMTLAAVVDASGLQDAEATLTLERRMNQGEWEAVEERRVALGEDGQLTRELFQITPNVVGSYEFRARIKDAGPELTLDDNTAAAAVRVVRQQIRVLLIAGGPSPEIQFLRNAMQRDAQVEFVAWLQHADPGYRQVGDRPILRLPNSREELSKYDALVLVDPDMKALGPEWEQMIVDFVGNDAGGLIFVAGELYSQQLFDEDAGVVPGESWTRILPVVRDPGLYRTEAEVRLSSARTYVLDLTNEGRADPIFAFHPDPIRNRAILSSLPGMYWSFPVTRARPGATVLARHGDPRMQNQYGRHVLLASQLYGPGRTVFLGFDSTYRWRYLSEDYFDGFWARLIDRVGRNKALGGRFPFQVVLGKESYRVGETVAVQVRFTDESAIAEGSDLIAELERAGEPSEPIRFERDPSDPAALAASFPADPAGAYTLRIVPATTGDPGAGVRVSTTTFRVDPPRREVDEPSLNRPLLDDLARLTGGQVLELTDIERLDELISMREVTRTLEARQELWNAPLLAALLMIALTSEWIIRKLVRMV
ncbi:VWA domain-containing protein [Tautonia marina]|uniref:VWA domain-containing protein n=1 Tax=Tautonia marina TaxID=2653855 RepID=UPI001260545C|nr:VWA domain-containing protein [Tautonia marina]